MSHSSFHGGTVCQRTNVGYDHNVQHVLLGLKDGGNSGMWCIGSYLSVSGPDTDRYLFAEAELPMLAARMANSMYHICCCAR